MKNVVISLFVVGRVENEAIDEATKAWKKNETGQGGRCHKHVQWLPTQWR